jgi:superfamily I DNA and RNA helicase
MAHAVISSLRYSSDALSKSIIENLQAAAPFRDDDSSVIYYDYPIYSDYDKSLYKPDICVWSSDHGFFVIKNCDAVLIELSATVLAQIDSELSDFASLLYSRFVKSRLLRKGIQTLKFEITPIIYVNGSTKGVTSTVPNSKVVTSQETLLQLLSVTKESVGSDVYNEVRSIIEGAKALAPAIKATSSPPLGRAASLIAKLEQDIHNFDVTQRQVALSLVPGPHRIRGLAGSGKTIIIAIKAALLHLSEPEKRILVTFYTRSLRDTLRTLITKFYRHMRDEDPDWTQIHVKHGWGSSSAGGVYSEASSRSGQLPISLREAQSKSSDPFAYACAELVKSERVTPYYDYVFIDEGQDFPNSFYELCYLIAQPAVIEKNIVWAYDELQNILNIKMRTAETLFGADSLGRPRLSLERASARIPAGQINDTVLTKCYRNQLEVLVTAHALGFGIYSKQIVQMLEDEAHWSAVGYELVKGKYEIGENVVLKRPAKNSPVSLSGESFPLISSHVAESFSDEIGWVIDEIKTLINEGVQPHSIMVVTLDDRNARSYLGHISNRLGEGGIATNNLLADRYSDPAFWIEGMVTLSTVYRAKGNEAAAVFVVGVDAVETSVRKGRNKVFTAFTRSKAWLRVSGVGSFASRLIEEVNVALSKVPNLEFEVPDRTKVDMIQHDISRRTEKVKRVRSQYLEQLDQLGISEGEVAQYVQGSGRGSKKI